MKTALIAITLGALSAAADAQNIIYTFSGTGNGSIGATAFSNADFTISVFADTADITTDTLGFAVEDLFSTFTVTGVGTGLFTEGERVFIAEIGDFAAVGFAQSASREDATDLLDLVNTEFVGYDLASSFGPVVATSVTAFDLFVNEPTTLGALTFTNVTTATFTATAIPEPSVALLGMVSVATLALGRRRSAGSGMTR